MLKAADVRKRVRQLAENTRDFEAAHGDEDEIHEDVLKAIAEGKCEDPAACAREALKTLDLKFPRHCA